MIAVDSASDGDEPSGSAALADAATALWLLGGGDEFRALAERIVAAHSAAALSQHLAHGALLRVAGTLAAPPRQVVVIADDPAAPLAAAARGIRADVVAVVSRQQCASWTDAGFSLFAGKSMQGGLPTAYDCRQFTCRLPVTGPRELAE